MNSNLLRHRLLGILSRQYVISENSDSDSIPLGVAFEKIYKELKCNEQELRISISELYENAEIGYYNVRNIVGLHAFERGIASYSTKKYRWVFFKNIIGSISISTNIIIPIFSFVISCIALYISVDRDKTKDTTELNTLKQRLELLEKHTNMQQPANVDLQSKN